MNDYRKHLVVCLLATAIFLGFGQMAPVFAQESDILPEIDVRGALRREELTTTSATVIDNTEITDHVYSRSALDMLTLAPGVSMGNPMANGTTGFIYIRGMQGGHAGEINFYIDGIPISEGGHSSNYNDLGMIMPLEIESLEIVKGPASVNYGRNAAGGAVSFQTIKSGNFTRLVGRLGTMAMYDFSGIIAKDIGPINHIYAFQIYRNPGWRDHDEMNRYNLSARWTINPIQELSLSLNVRAYRADWENAGSIYRFMDRNDAVDDGSGYYGGGFRNRYDLRFWANYFLTDEQQLTFYAFFTDLEADRMPNSLPSAAQLTASGSSAYDYPNFKPGTQRSGSIEYNTRRAYGLGLAYNFIGKLAERDISLTTGIDFLHEVDHRQNYRGSVVTFPWGQGMWKDKQNLNNNLRTTIDTFSLFAEVNYQVLDQLKLRLGARYDSWNSELDDYSGNRLGVSGHRSAISPKAGVLYQPLDWLEFFTSYGVSYSVPDPASSALTGFYSGSAELQKRDQIEVGYRASPLDWLEISSTAFWLFTTNDSTLDINGNTVYEGETLRQGLENSIRVMPLDYLLFSLDYTYLDARTRKGNVASGPTDGLRLTNSPRHLTSLQVSYAPPEGFGGFLKFHWTADWLSTSTPIATVKQTDRGYLDGQLSYRFNEKYKVRFDLTNILDQKFEQYNPDNTSTINPMPPRLFYLSFEVNYN